MSMISHCVRSFGGMIAAALRPASLKVHARPVCLFSVTEEQLQPLPVKTTKAKKGKKHKRKKKGENKSSKKISKKKGKNKKTKP